MARSSVKVAVRTLCALFLACKWLWQVKTVYSWFTMECLRQHLVVFLPIFHESGRPTLCTSLSRALLEVCSPVQSAPESTQLKSLPRRQFCGSCRSKYVKPMFRIHLGLPDASSPNAQRLFCRKCNYAILRCFFLMEICLFMWNVRLHVLQSSTRIDLSRYSCTSVWRNETMQSCTTFRITVFSISC